MRSNILFALYLNRELEPGWKMVGKTGTKEECLEYLKKIRPDIKEVWTDMRPYTFHEPTNTVVLFDCP